VGRKIRVFISYSSKNRKQAKAVHKALEIGGFEVWRDERRIESDWSAEIAVALAQADLICLLWTNYSARSRWVKNEWSTARALEKLIVPCLFPDAPKLPEQIENLQGLPFPNTVAGLRKLTVRLKSQTLFHRKYDFRAPPLRGYVPFAPDDDFTGRKADLLALYLDLIGQLNKIGINHVGAVGMGGVGKTELAIEFAYRFGFIFDGVYWIQGNEANQLGAELVRLARDLLGLKIADPAKADANSRYLLKLYSYSKKHPQMLVIVDNVTEPDLLANTGVLPGGRFALLDLGCNLLFTTRKRFRLTGVKAHSVDVLPPEAALELLTRARSPATDKEWSLAQEICNAVGYLPLALALIGAYLRNYPQISFGQYLEILRKRRLGAIDTTKIGETELATRHEAAVGATLHSQWKLLRDQSARLALKIAAHFPEGTIIPAGRIGLLAGLEDKESEMEMPLARTVNLLQQLSLIGRVENLAALRVHPLVAAFVRGLIPGRTRMDFLYAAATRLKTAYDDPFRLKAEYQSRGIDQVIEDLDDAIAWVNGHRQLERELRLLQRLLDRERQHLRLPAAEAPQLRANLFQQLHQRAAIMGLTKLAATFLQAGLSDGHPMLRVRASSVIEDLARVRTFQGHDTAVVGVAVSLDGRRLITGSIHRRVILWDLSTGQILRALKGHKSIVKAVAISPDGLRALSGGWDKKLICWNLETGKKLWQGRGHAEGIESIEITADGSTALSGSLDKTMILWDVASGRKIARLKGHKNGVTKGALSRDGRYALSGDIWGSVCVWDVQRESRMYRFKIDPSADNIRRGITALSFSPDAKVAAIAAGYGGRSAVEWFGPDREGRLFLWDLDARRVLRNFKGHTALINAIVFSSDGARLLSGSSDKTLKLWDVRTGRCQRTFVGHTREVTAVALTAGDRHAVSGGWDANAILWEVNSTNRATISTPARRRSTGHSLWVRSADLSADGKIAATSSDDGSVILWNARTGSPLRTLKGHAERVNSVKLTANGSCAVSGDHSGTVILWDTRKGDRIATIETGKGRIHAVNLSPDRRMVLSGSVVWLIVWDVEKRKLLQGFRHPEDFDDDDSDGITAIVVSNDGRVAISAAEDSKKLFLWDLRTVAKLRNKIIAADRSMQLFLQKSLETKLAAFEGHSSGVLALDHDRKDTRVLSGSRDGTAILWDARNQRPLLRLEGHSEAVNSVALATARRAISTSWDKTLILWDLESGGPALRLYFESPLSAIAARGDQVIGGDIGGTVYFFAIEEPKKRRIHNARR
jgi:WD40 repeat protein